MSSSSTRKNATLSTKTANGVLLKELPFNDQRDFEDAKKGFVAPLPNSGVLKREDGKVVWDVNKYSQFIKEGSSAPDTVNPSLWRQCQLTNMGGLYKVTERMYQIRNADLSNMTILEGDTGLIVIDPLISMETARGALDLYLKHRPQRPVRAVFYSHSHVDHFGGVKGVVTQDDVTNGNVIIVAPQGFVDAAISENVLAGNVMARRATYMFGNLLPADAKGQVGTGLGMTSSSGTITLIPPTHIISRTGQKMCIDGLNFEFMMAPDTEAPAEMHWYIEELRAVTAAENCCHVMHNVYTPRGAKVRDPLAWSKYLQLTLQTWGHKSTLMYGMHHWPVWGRERVAEMLKKGRDGYRFINDQTLRLANQGYTMDEIAEHLRLPPDLQKHWAFRGYYGTLNHNVKAAYVKYLGWFDGNPANLHPLPPVEASTKYIEYMGGAERVLERAKIAFEKGEYRWVCEIVNRVVFADPENRDARGLQADALEQLGYQAESGVWRNFYLTGAQELRVGLSTTPAPRSASRDTNSALSHVASDEDGDADASLKLTREAINRVILRESTFPEEISAGNIIVDGDLSALAQLMSLLDNFQFWFNIVEPRSKL